MNQHEQQNKQNQGGRGSAENVGGSRADQKHAPSDLSAQERKDISDEIASGSTPVSSLKDTGALSGRDDAAGGSGDGMENTSTGEPTERF